MSIKSPPVTVDESRPSKRPKLLSDEESSDSEASNASEGGVKVNGHDTTFSINKEYARRFEHNSKRAELQQLEEKYGENGELDTDDDSTSASEDDDAELASGALEADFHATLQAIKTKDPRIYKQEEVFYNVGDADHADRTNRPEKPMFLKDYHRQNLLNGTAVEQEQQLPSYQEQQDALKKSLVKEMHAMDSEASESESDRDMFKVKDRPALPIAEPAMRTEDVDKADQDPEGFLAKFLHSRAWVAKGSATAHVFESDDEEEDRRADEFEESYNLRFENPKGINEKLITHARDTAAKYSVRDEAKSSRQRARELERAKKDELKSERVREKAQLKRLRMEEMEKKLEKITEAAGRSNTKLELDEWTEFLAEDWDDDKWEGLMNSKFNEKYYAQRDANLSDEESSSKKTSKPKWNNDIDIGDIVPDFDNDDTQFSLSEDEPPTVEQTTGTIVADRREARKNKRKLDQFVEEQVRQEIMMRPTGKTNSTFRYRDTSPMDWGLTPRDILMASDGQLNQFAGLKKLASFREADKRKRDKKKLGKKARLRQWRRETFGNVDGPQTTIQDIMKEAQQDELSSDILGDTEQHESHRDANGTGKRKRSGRRKKDKQATAV